MKPEPFAWAYQNANTEHQYLVWHKQDGGRNWMPLFTQTDVQEAILAERQRIVNLLMIQHKASNGAHNYWHVAAQLIQADVASDT